MSGLPVLPGFYPDPSICRVGDRYFIVNSTFEHLPGVPIHTSTDLLEWVPVGHVFTTPEQLDLGSAPSNAGIYAPTIRHWGDMFFVATTDFQTARQGQLIARTSDPAGQWSVPVRVVGAIGIDPDLFWDTDDTCHLSWKGYADDGQSGILSVPVDPVTGERLGPVRQLWQGIDGMASPEGPHLYLRDGWYYCLLAQGGTERGHCVAVARSRSLDGPWEPAPTNPILSHRSTSHPVQNTGHADLVETPDGAWAMVYLGVRPRGMVPKFHVNGRETFIAGVEWVDGWPVVDESRYEPVRIPTGFRDDFSADSLHSRWISHGGVHRRAVALVDGGLEVTAVESPWPVPAIGVRARDESWRARVRWSGDGIGALRLHMDTENWVEIRLEVGRVVVEHAVTGIRTELASAACTREEVVALAVASEPWPASWPANQGPDTVSLTIETVSGSTELARIDGRLLSTEFTAGFTGRTIGVRATQGRVVVSEFSYEPLEIGDGERTRLPE